MFDSNENDPISPALRALLELFTTELAEVRFPDMNGEVLDAAAEQVREQAEAVARAQAALESARQALHESQEALLQKGQRALAYARVFSEENVELSAKLDGIHLPRAARKGARADGAAADPASAAQGSDENAPRRRGRPPKARAAAGASLFADGSTPEALAAAAHHTGNGMLSEA
ncbi:hypothetical protein HUW63_15275 [Myxococcus sp. AM001]|uniref:hypothetical protein n=1 Tax=unclassified Myxococcus TaxID=2648731 RepID=UPI001595FCB8|nr:MULTISPECIES: hypothetical protein [unclassified Myxococcus]NVI98817.1 hypothetical protein [Myxococcus sp. AM009]NVJ06595.1 hypothetical protein [Myxococcus sp. AM001]WIG94353.1 hypothetical protein KGD87_27970 [Myxococcus sp. SDU36]